MIQTRPVGPHSRDVAAPHSGSEWIPPWRPGPVRMALHRTARVFFGVFARRAVTGLENVPPHGPVLLVFNHLSNFDPHLIFAALPRRDANGLVTSRYRANPVTRFLVEQAGGIWRAVVTATGPADRGLESDPSNCFSMGGYGARTSFCAGARWRSDTR